MSGSGLQRPSGLKQPNKIGKGVANSTSTTSTHRPTNESEKNFGDFSHSYALASAIFTNDDWPMRKKISDASLVLTENTDDFIIGDRVWVGGTKGGHIQYIGETQFAPGEWAGVVLEDPVGKNDGSVAGVRYFMCEPKRGVFSRLTKLSREPIQHLIDEEREAEAVARANGSSSGRNSPLLPRAASPVSSLSNMARRLDATSSPRGSNSNLSIGDSLRVGVRVIVQSANGTKTGTLRFLGVADFASGEWAGIELDEPIGKNDGSVAGRRYFTCKSKHGLFAPVHKVSRIPGTPITKRVSTSTRPTLVSGLSRRTGSHESLNSSISSASNTARAARVRLGITSLSSQKTPLKSSVRPSLGATQNAMQEALKEKEQHIEQLLKERDMERAEVAKAAVQVEDCERKLNALRNEHQLQLDDAEKRMARFRSIAEGTEQQRKDLLLQLEEERRKVEDLQFRVEEEAISKGDLERNAQVSRSATEADAQKIKDLEQALDEERKRHKTAESNLQKTQDAMRKLTSDVEQLKNQLRMSENSVMQLQSTKEEFGEQASHTASELTRKEKKVSELETTVEAKNKEIHDLNKHIHKLEDAIEHKQKTTGGLQNTIDSLKSKLQASDEDAKRVQDELKGLKLSYSDSQRKLEASEQRFEQTNKNRVKLEQDIADLMQNKGSNSEQLSKMNEELRRREGTLEELQSKLQHSSQMTAQLQEKLEQVQQQAKEENEKQNNKHKEQIDSINAQLQSLTSDLQRSEKKLAQKSQHHETELEQLHSKKSAEIKELKCEIESRDSQIGMLSHQLRDVRRHVQDLAQRNIQETVDLEEVIQKLKTEKEKIQYENNENNRLKQQLEVKLKQLEDDNEHLRNQYKQNETAVRERDAKLLELTAETERLRLEFGNHRTELKKKLAENQLEEQAIHEMRQQIEMQAKLIEELQNTILQSEKEKDELLDSLRKLEALQAQHNQLESTSSELKQQIRELKQKLGDVENDKVALQNKLAANELKLKQKEDDHKKQLAKANTDRKNSIVQELEQDKLQLSNKIVELQVALERSKENVTSTDTMADVYREDKLAAEGQIEFLNSVIVDMQKKNDQLQARIQALESPSVSDDINLNGIKTPVVLPRLFCDICDMFDLHDTEDCPRQASPDSPPPSQHHGNRNQVRPYCDICEVFGHWTNQCNDDEMF